MDGGKNIFYSNGEKRGMKTGNEKKYRYYIGIDTGVNTGFAIWDKQQKSFYSIQSIMIHDALNAVTNWYNQNIISEMFVRVEDARKRKWFGKRSDFKVQGAGSIKRDAKIWEDFLNDLGVDFEMVAPKNNKTKMNAESFKKITGWQGKTNEHARDAAMLVYGL